MAVVGQHVAEVARQRRDGIALSVELRVGVAFGFVRLVVSLLRGSPRQSSGGRPSSAPSLRRMLLWLAQA